MKHDVLPFQEFWTDCFSTILYTIVLSSKEVEKKTVYNNDYTYQIVEEKLNDKRFHVIRPVADLSMLKDCMLDIMKKVEVKISKKDDIEQIIYYLDNNKLMVICVDMFDWIPDSLYYKKNHMIHFALVVGYDREDETLIIYDCGGTEGYHEYRMPFAKVAQAMQRYKEECVVVDFQNINPEKCRVNKENLISNAKRIMESIQKVFQHLDSIYEIDTFNMELSVSFGRIICTHIFSMSERALGNAKLLGENSVYYNEFESIHKQFHSLKIRVIKSYESRAIHSEIGEIKGCIQALLQKEYNLWKNIIEEDGNV